MRFMTMSEKKNVTIAKMLESDEPISLTCNGRVVAFIRPDKAAVAAHREKLGESKQQEAKSRRAKRKGSSARSSRTVTRKRR